MATKLLNTLDREINPATEETLQAVAGVNFDTLDVDTTDPASITITKKMGATVISVKTINIT